MCLLAVSIDTLPPNLPENGLEVLSFKLGEDAIKDSILDDSKTHDGTAKLTYSTSYPSSQMISPFEWTETYPPKVEETESQYSSDMQPSNDKPGTHGLVNTENICLSRELEPQCIPHNHEDRQYEYPTGKNPFCYEITGKKGNRFTG